MQGIWIRSQDKTVLVFAQRITTMGTREGKRRIINQIAYRNDCDDYDTLGEYSTQEKALKVLDEIQGRLMGGKTMDGQLLEPGSVIIHDKNEKITFIPGNGIMFYQMPQDGEVEV